MKNKQELDLIDRDWLSAECVRAILDPQEALDFLLARIKNAKPIDAVPVVHAEWRFQRVIDDDECLWLCTGCGYSVGTYGRHIDPGLRYCPNCGAKMDAKEE